MIEWTLTVNQKSNQFVFESKKNFSPKNKTIENRNQSCASKKYLKEFRFGFILKCKVGIIFLVFPSTAFATLKDFFLCW